MTDQYTFTPIEALEVIKGLAEGSRTVNTLPHIAKIAAASLAASEAWLRSGQMTGAEYEGVLREASDMREACRQVAERYVAASGNTENPNEYSAGWEACAKAIEHEIRAGDPVRHLRARPALTKRNTR